MAKRNIRFGNFFQGESVAVFPGLGVIFNRIKKSGNTSIVAFLDDLERAGAGDLQKPVTASEIKSRRSLRALPFRGIPRLPSFATLTSVRNPYHRAISGFLDKVGSGTNPRYQNYPTFGDRSVSAFEEFLVQCGENQFFRDRHFYPQTELLFQPLENYSQILRLETLVDDMDAFLTRRGFPAGTARALSSPHRLEQAETGKIQHSSKQAHYLTDHAIRIINKLYDRDFALLGYARMMR
jgi:hypothetical protein